MRRISDAPAWTGRLERRPEFEPSAIGAIHRHSGGIPRRINTLGNRLMMLGFLDELHAFTAEDVDRVAADLANEINAESQSRSNGAANRGPIARSQHADDRTAARDRKAPQPAGNVHAPGRHSCEKFVHLANSTERLAWGALARLGDSVV